MTPGLSDLPALLAGPTGGALALAFGLGCAATYTFLLTTTIKGLLGQVAEWKGLTEKAEQKCEEQCREKDARIKELEHLMLFEAIGANRQRAQLVASERRLGDDVAEKILKGEIVPGTGAVILPKKEPE